MRGASALGEQLAAHPEAPVRVLVVWLPVVATDLGPPADEVRKPLRDVRVTEFWDPGRWASPLMMQRAALSVRAQGGEPDWGSDAIAWDVIALFPAGTAWEDPFPVPTWWDGPVVEAIPTVEEQLSGTP